MAAAEQLFKNIPKSGEQKKQFVLDYLEANGFTYDTDAVDLLIEAAVLNLKQ